MNQQNRHYKFENIPLPYPYDALEPYIDAKTMELHHDRHLQTYIDNLNNILKDYPELQDSTLIQLICNADLFPENIRQPILNNAGGVYNHDFYFNQFDGSEDEGSADQLAMAINNQFGSFDEFKKQFKDAALSVFGSGYAWLVLNPDNKELEIITTANQDTPFPLNRIPILNIDVWEHAYYLKHYNKRADYIDDWFQVINWNKVSDNYLKTLDWLR
ncbi:superoxide dismutase [Aminipila luticellarii]|uniref:Superoxide dismutase n=2 Tax=Aminipila luticellarii TaxID=2507160 RepID=A0A410PZ25_9FIRM|nr:superoxide dismutase [Aminipila luticellarii]QAT44086.1 superoxide dismutase [Aminipila luticellarii]